jgi:aryl-alcohol dehydrogenase-like predicted oxidoreductase
MTVFESIQDQLFFRACYLLDKWDAACNRLELTPLQLALEYVLAHSSIERIIVGVDNVLQLIEIIEADIGRKKFNFPELESNDIELIEPSRWNVP